MFPKLAVVSALALVVFPACGREVSEPPSQQERGDGGSAADATAQCFASWATVSTKVSATTRPASNTLRIEFSYATVPGMPGLIELKKITAGGPALSSDGPFSVSTHSGSWVELRDASDRTLYTRRKWALVAEQAEASGPDGFHTLYLCPGDGVIILDNLPNDPQATQVVLFQEPIDGMSNPRAVELARFPLP